MRAPFLREQKTKTMWEISKPLLLSLTVIMFVAFEVYVHYIAIIEILKQINIIQK